METKHLLKLHKQMLVLRHLDEICMELKLKDLIMNGFHPYSGQEAVAVGFCDALNPGDAVLSNHRPQGHSLAKGTTPRQIFCEMLGRRGGVSQGIGGPMQWIDAANDFYCGSIVGSSMPLAVGVAQAFKAENKGRIALCFFGDGASNTGAFHESLNLAAIWKLPVVFVCENNLYAEAMPVQEFVSVSPISKRAVAYGIPGSTIDGMDIVTVANAAKAGVEQVRKTSIPVFIEAITYRFRGHYGGDPEHTYRTKEEVAVWRQKDPLLLSQIRLLSRGITEDTLEEMEDETLQSLREDESWALDQPFPTVEEATDHVIIPLTESRG